ncbi:hypothetical protein PR003_g28421, partial [Phytophthora rubi]
NTTTTGAAAAPHFGSNKPPKFDEEGGFDLYKAMLQSYLMQRGAWGILDGTDMLDANAMKRRTPLREMRFFVVCSLKMRRRSVC